MKSLKIFSIMAIVVIAFIMLGCEEEDQETLVVYNWGDYIDQELLRQFEEEENVRVIYQEYATNEDLYVKLSSSLEAIDVIIPSDYMLSRLIKEGLVQKIDMNNIPNLQDINTDFMNQSCDPTGEYGVPYLWQTLGIIYNSAKFPEGINKWADLWNPKYEKEIVLYNAQRDVLTVALSKLGYSINTSNIDELKEAEEELLKQKEINYAYLGDEIKDVLVNEDANIGMVYSGDAGVIMSQNPNYKYVIPEEGSNMAIDFMAIPKTAKNKPLAEKFINFMTRTDVALNNTRFIMYNSPIDKVREMLPEEITNYGLYPTEEEMKRLTIYDDMSEYNAVYNKIWTEITSGM
ncbi:MAG: spermidine/putrescine ABC transporter substrate-binding protein [Ezakiella sp.]|nr:spermidine/putrescine ABC transporter substrate-binding protein [Ezakiella sp.]MDY3947348.1 spermidine/putrescine ABC transporter substrate-binding protein [Ezakiella sp.]